jgi:hypothetical protein
MPVPEQQWPSKQHLTNKYISDNASVTHTDTQDLSEEP